MADDADPAAGTSDPNGEPVSVLEVERKYGVHGLFRLPEIPGASEPVTTVLTATYYDTDDLRLAREGRTLRRRTGGKDEGWHLKLPTGVVGAREEVQLPLSAAGPDDDPPAALTDLVLAITRGAPVRPVASLRTERTTYDVKAGDGRLIAELTDDGVEVLDGDRVAAKFRQLELETRHASGSELEDIETALLAAGAVAGDFTSKAKQALGPRASEPPDIPPPPGIGPDLPAGDAVRAHLARHVRAFVDQDPRVRRDGHDAVHQMRVAARRIRSGLKVFAPLVEQKWADSVRAELGWIAAVLGGVRDREVLLARLERDLGRLDASDSRLASVVVHRALQGAMAQARAELTGAMRSERYLRLLDALVEAAREPSLTDAAAVPAAQALPPLVAQAWRRLGKRAKTLSPKRPDSEWHECRIAAKKARYATEACVPVFGAPARALAKQAESITECLGEHQDAVVAALTLREMAREGDTDGPTGFALGLLHEVQRHAADSCKAEFADLWQEASRARYRRWLA